MSKLRVYMLAKELGIENKDLVSVLQSMGVGDVKNHMSALSPEQVERVKRHLSRPGDQPVVEQRLQPRGGTGPVIIRRGKKKADSSPTSEIPVTSGADRGSAHDRSSPERSAPRQSAPRQGVPRQGAPERGELRSPNAHGERSAPERSAPKQSAPERGSAERSGQDRSAPERSAPEHSSVERSTPERGERAAAEQPAAVDHGSVDQSAAAQARGVSERNAGSNESSAADERSAPLAAKPVAVAAPEVEDDDPESAPHFAEAVSAAASLVDSKPVTTGATPRAAEVAAAPPAPAQRVAAAQAPQRAEIPRRPGLPAAPAPARAQAAPQTPVRPSTPPRTGIDVWEGRPGVPMPQPVRASVPPRRVQYDAKAGGAGPNARRGPGGSPMASRRGPAPRRGIGAMRGRPGMVPASTTQERSAHKKVVKIEESIALQQLAARIGAKAGQVLMKLMSLGMTGININSTLDSDTAKIVAGEFGWTVEDVAVTEDEAIALAQGELDEEKADRVPRPPVISVMGHVDHGKTSLLDRIRKASVASEEAGGITQHIGAYSVKTPKGRITFLDTPGHAAFSAMRARGARCTDIVVLVVAADDGVMPQTKEAIVHARAAGCPIVVAINKIDKPDAQPERIRRELSEQGLMPEEWGGQTLFVEVSAMTGKGMDELLDSLLLQADMLELRASPKRPAQGTVIEAKLDRGRGPVATVLVTDGTLVKGAGLLVGASWGRVRAMLDENGRSVAEAGPSTPVSVIGLNEVPAAGDAVNAVTDAKKAQEIADSRRTKERRTMMSTSSKVSLEEAARRLRQADAKELKVIVKADVHGSVEALHSALEGLSTDTVELNVVHSAVGAVTEGDVNLAVAAGAIIVAFNVRPAGKAASHAQREGIEVRQYSIIYNALDDIKAAMEGLLAPDLVEEAIGEAEVRKVFRVSKAGVVAGCMVTSGVVRRNSLVRVRREAAVVWEGKLDSLKRFKDDAREVREGFDCGISLSGYSDIQEGDIIAAFEVREVRSTL